MIIKQVEIGKPQSDDINRTSDFDLLPLPRISPIITSQPANNIQQRTWIRAISNNRPVYQVIVPEDQLIRVVEGTEVTWTFFAYDPTVPMSQTPYSGLSYKWTKDGTDLTAINLLNAERGVKSVKITKEACTPELSGDYVCQVTNRYGTTETNPLRLRIIKPKQEPRLYANLLRNGNAQSSTDGWTIDPDIKSTPFGDVWATTHNSSIAHLSIWYRGTPIPSSETLQKGPVYRNASGENFRFGVESSPLSVVLRPWENWQNFPSNQIPYWMRSHRQVDSNEGLQQGETNFLSTWNRWIMASMMPCLVSNEALEGDKFGTFFPAMSWIDAYNKNENVIGLLNESKEQQLHYFTRDKIKFEKFGGTPVSTMRQTVDVTDLADYIDGNVYGIAHLTSQFFSYIGAGITNYKIRVKRQFGIQAGGVQEEYNWQIADGGSFGDIDLPSPSLTQLSKIRLTQGSDIEIIPLAEDKTEVQLLFKGADGSVLLTTTIKGPTEQDVWAVKEKAYLPLTLHSLYRFVDVNTAVSRTLPLALGSTTVTGSSIKVFGQTYTTVDDLRGFFDRSNFQRAWSRTHASGGTGVVTGQLTVPGVNLLPQFLVSDSMPAPARIQQFSEWAGGYINNAASIDPNYTVTRAKLLQIAAVAMVTYNFSPTNSKLFFVSSFVGLNINAAEITVLALNAGTSDLYWGLDYSVRSAVKDVNASFLGKNFPFAAWGSVWPQWWEATANGAVEQIKQARAVEERGAAAMFGVESTRVVPKGTRSVEVVVKFVHTSEVISDGAPDAKGWTSEYLYLDSYGQQDGANPPAVEYGNPKCGITKMKLLFVPNNFGVDEDFPSYKLPPAEFTTLGLSRDYILSNQVNTSYEEGKIIRLQDEFTKPVLPPPLEVPVDPFLIYDQQTRFVNSDIQRVAFESSQDPSEDTQSQSDEQNNP